MRRCLMGILLFTSAVSAFCNATTGDVLVAPFPPPGPPGGIPIPFLLLDSTGVQKATFGLGHQVVTNGSSIFTTAPFTAYNLGLQQTGTTGPAMFVFAQTTDASGHAYVIDGTNPGTVNVYDAAANLTRQITLPMLPGSIDLAPDNCTLFWIGSGRAIHRYDICANTPLADPAPGAQAVFVRALTGGGFLAGRDLNLTFYDANGAVVRTINTGNFVSWASFTPDGQAMWVASTGNLARIPISGSSANLTANVSAEMVSVVGEQRPTIAQVLATSAPALSTWWLGLLAAALIAVAIIRAG